MNYATPQDMLDRYSERELIQLTDVDDTGAVNMVRMQTKLDDAHAVIDGRIGRVYQLPLLGCAKPTGERVAPPQLTRIACDMARFWLYDSIGDDSDVYRRYKAAMRELDDVADGKALLSCQWGGSAGELVGADAQDGVEVAFHFAPRAITDCEMRGF